jgi:hypothetical protein
LETKQTWGDKEEKENVSNLSSVKGKRIRERENNGKREGETRDF